MLTQRRRIAQLAVMIGVHDKKVRSRRTGVLRVLRERWSADSWVGRTPTSSRAICRLP